VADLSVDGMMASWVIPKRYRSVGDFAIYNTYGRWKFEYITCDQDCYALSFKFITDILNKFRCKGKKKEFVVSYEPAVGEYDFTNCGPNANFMSTEFLDLYHHRFIQQLIEDNREHIYPGVFFSGNFENERYDLSQRSLYQDHVKRRPEYFKSRSTSNNGTPGVEHSISLSDHKDYEYLIDLMGHVYSSRSLWLLLTKRAFFASPYDKHTHYWEHDLKGFTHFIPVEKDLSDLEEKFLWANRNQSKVNKIIEVAYEYGIKHFSYESVVKRVLSQFESTDLVEEMFEQALKRISDLKISMSEYLSYNKIVTDDLNKIDPSLYSITDKLSEVGDCEVFYYQGYQKNIHVVNYMNFYFPGSKLI